jgi:hypothetical protein
MALLQSLMGVNHGHGRMTTGMPSTHLSRCPAPAAGSTCFVVTGPLSASATVVHASATTYVLKPSSPPK